MKRRKLTSRERWLAILCAVVAGIMFSRLGILSPRKGIRGNLDREIAEKEAKLIMLTEAKQLVESVDEDYNRYRMMMSDERTEEEVRGKVQAAMYVLASEAGVTIPTIKQGSTDTFAYYKRYLVTVDIQGSPQQIANFMALLEDSPMLLHVEKLTIDRQRDNRVRGRLTVSRSLVPSAEHDMPAGGEEKPAMASAAGAAPVTKLLTAVSASPAPANMMFNGGFEDWDENDQPNGWRVLYAEVKRDVDRKTEGTVACMLRSQRDRAFISQDLTLQTGTTYTWSARAAVLKDEKKKRGKRGKRGKTSLMILEGASRRARGVKKAVQELEGSDMTYYEQQFTTPGTMGSTCSIRFQLQFEKAGSVAYLDNVTIFATAGI